MPGRVRSIQLCGDTTFRQMLSRVAPPYVFLYSITIESINTKEHVRQKMPTEQPRKHLPRVESSGCAAHTGDDCVMF